jgi:hypothetical protein
MDGATAGRPASADASDASVGAPARGASPSRTPSFRPRQRVTHRFRRHLLARARCGRMPRSPARNARRATKSSAPSGSGIGRTGGSLGPPRRLALDEAAHRHGSQALAAAVSDPDPGVVEVLDGRSRRTSSATCARRMSVRRSRSSRSIPTTRTTRRSRPHYRERGSAAIPSTSCAAPTRTRHSQARAPAPRPARFAWLRRSPLPRRRDASPARRRGRFESQAGPPAR